MGQTFPESVAAREQVRLWRVEIRGRPFPLTGTLLLPRLGHAVVLIANSGDPTQLDSPANVLARLLCRHGFAALVMDFLMPASIDPKQRISRFDTGLVAARTIVTIDWASGKDSPVRGMPLGCMAFSSATAAVVLAAAERPDAVGALVGVDARLSAAEPALAGLAAPLLLVARRRDEATIHESHRAVVDAPLANISVRTVGGRPENMSRQRLHEIAEIAAGWFRRHLG